MTPPVGARESASAGTDPVTSAVATGPEIPAYEFDCAVSAADLALTELARLVTAWHQHEPGARTGEDPEELHQLRVTTRRIDATLALFEQQLPPALSKARKTAKALLRSLGAARDIDVQLAELGDYCAQLPEAQRAAAVPLQERLGRERTKARTRMIRGLDSAPVRRWIEALDVASARRGEEPDGEPALSVMPERVRRRFRKLRKAVGRLRPKSSMDDYHQVRRRAKQLRYATECGALLFGKPADELLKALRRLQDKLGAQQDAFMAQNRLTALAAEPDGLPPATLFLMGRLAERHARVTADTRRTLDRSWRKVRGKRWKALRARLVQLSAAAPAPQAYDEPDLEFTAVPATVAASANEPRSVKH